MTNSIATQTKALFKKNFFLITRNQKYLLIFLIAPFFSVWYINNYDKISRENEKGHFILDMDLNWHTSLPKCPRPKNCSSLGYYIIGEEEEWIEPVMKSLEKPSGLKFGTDIRKMGQGSPKDFKDYVKNNANMTQVAVIFCTRSWDVDISILKGGGPMGAITSKEGNKTETEAGKGKKKDKEAPGGGFVDLDNLNTSIPCSFSRLRKEKGKRLIFYTVAYNESLDYQSPYFREAMVSYSTSKMALNLKGMLDGALIRYFGTSEKYLNGAEKKIGDDFDYSVASQAFPQTMLRFFKGRSFVELIGSFFCFFPISVSQKKFTILQKI